MLNKDIYLFMYLCIFYFLAMASKSALLWSVLIPQIISLLKISLPHLQSGDNIPNFRELGGISYYDCLLKIPSDLS